MVAPTETLPTVDHGRPFDPAAIRSQFPIFDRPLPNGQPLIYLDSAATAQKPHSVIEKERECYERYYANAYRGDYQFGVQIDEELEATRAKIRDFIGASQSEEIIFTSGTTMSINLVAEAWGRKFLKPGDEILLTQMEHHANLVPWQQVAHATGAVLKYIPLTSDWQLDLNRLGDVLTDRTKLVALSGMSNVLGTVPPIREIAAAALNREPSCSSTCTKCAAPGHECSRARDRLPRLLRSQTLRSQRRRRSVGPAPFVGSDGSFSLRRTHDLRGLLGSLQLGRDPRKIRGRQHALPVAPKRSLLRTAVDFDDPSVGMAAIQAHDLDLTVYALYRLSTAAPASVSPNPPRKPQPSAATTPVAHALALGA